MVGPCGGRGPGDRGRPGCQGGASRTGGEGRAEDPHGGADDHHNKVDGTKDPYGGADGAEDHFSGAEKADDSRIRQDCNGEHREVSNSLYGHNRTGIQFSNCLLDRNTSRSGRNQHWICQTRDQSQMSFDSQ